MATAPALGMLTPHWELGRAGQRAAKHMYVGREMLHGLGAERMVRAGRLLLASAAGAQPTAARGEGKAAGRGRWGMRRACQGPRWLF